MDIIEIRRGLKDRLASIPGVNGYRYVAGEIVTPAGVVGPAECEYDEAFKRGLDKATFRVWMIVGTGSAEGANETLDRYQSGYGSQSVKAAVRRDKTLGGHVDDCRVVDSKVVDIQMAEVGVTYLAAEFTVDVYADSKEPT